MFYIIEKMVETWLRWFGYEERRPIHSVVRRIDQMKGNQIPGGRCILRSAIREIIKKDLHINESDRDMIYMTEHYDAM